MNDLSALPVLKSSYSHCFILATAVCLVKGKKFSTGAAVFVLVKFSIYCRHSVHAVFVNVSVSGAVPVVLQWLCMFQTALNLLSVKKNNTTVQF